MGRRYGPLLAAAALLVLALVVLALGEARAEPKSLKDQVIGAWSLVSGSQIGPDAEGLLILDASGRMSMQIMNPNRAKFASNSRVKGTAEENQAAVHGMISYFGRYLIDEAGKTINYEIERSSYPNWDRSQQKRPFTVSATELRYTNPAPSSGGPAAALVWKRIN